MIKQLIKNKFLSEIGLYSFTNLLVSGLPFYILPFLTSYLEPADLAMLAVFQLTANFSMPFVGFNTSTFLNVVFYQSDKQIGKVGGSAVVLMLICGLGLIALMFLLSSLLYPYTGLSILWLSMLVFYVFSENVIEYFLTLLRLDHKSMQFAIFRVIKAVFDLGLSIGLVLWVKDNWEMRLLGMIGASAILSIVLLFFLGRVYRFNYHIDLKDWKATFQFGMPLIPHIVGGAIVNYSDILFLKNMSGEDAAGIYSVGYQVGMIIGFVQNSFNQAWTPKLFELIADPTPERKRWLVKVTYLFYLFMLLMVLGLTLFAPLIFEFFIGEKFTAALDVVFWVALGFGFNGMYKMVVGYLIYYKKTVLIGSISAFIGGLNIVLNYFFISNLGMVGAGMATAISFLVQFLIVWYYAHKVYPLQWFKISLR